LAKRGWSGSTTQFRATCAPPTRLQRKDKPNDEDETSNIRISTQTEDVRRAVDWASINHRQLRPQSSKGTEPTPSERRSNTAQSPLRQSRLQLQIIHWPRGALLRFTEHAARCPWNVAVTPGGAVASAVLAASGLLREISLLSSFLLWLCSALSASFAAMGGGEDLPPALLASLTSSRQSSP